MSFPAPGTIFFTMEGGTISGNKAYTNGGGVYIDENGIFSKAGGTIYEEDGGANKNTVNAVYVNSSPPKIRTDTADSKVPLDTTIPDYDANWI